MRRWRELGPLLTTAQGSMASQALQCGSGPGAGAFGAALRLRLDGSHDTVVVTMATMRMV